MQAPNTGRHRCLVVVALLLTAVTLHSSAAQLNLEEPETAAVAAFAKNGTLSDVFTFTAQDFVVTSGDLELDSIVLTALPDYHAGILSLGQVELAVGDVLALEAVDGLRFTPLSNPQVPTTAFSFTPIFADGSAGEDTQVNLYLLSSENSSPIAQNLTFSTYKNVAITQNFSAVDPEGDLLTFRLVDKPARGAVTLPEEGSTQFVYTPYDNKTGKDSFTYVAVDAVGNVSQPATVQITIEKASTTVSYVDMEGNSAHKAAIRLAEEGIFVGEMMGGQYFFQPDTPVSRDEFVALAMHTVGLEALEGITRTGFADDEAIATWAKPYVSSALKAGVVQGSLTEEGVVFQPDNTITKAEAAVLLDRLLEVTDVSTPLLTADADLTPSWAYQATANLETVGVLQTDGNGSLAINSNLTRGEVAELLCGALDLLEAREPEPWFHW